MNEIRTMKLDETVKNKNFELNLHVGIHSLETKDSFHIFIFCACVRLSYQNEMPFYE
jgi:hypothetical protein